MLGHDIQKLLTCLALATTASAATSNPTWSRLSLSGTAPPAVKAQGTFLWSDYRKGYYIGFRDSFLGAGGGFDGQTLRGLHIYYPDTGVLEEVGARGDVPPVEDAGGNSAFRPNYEVVRDPTRNRIYLVGQDGTWMLDEASLTYQRVTTGHSAQFRFAVVWSPPQDGFYVLGGYRPNFQSGETMHVQNLQFFNGAAGTFGTYRGITACGGGPAGTLVATYASSLQGIFTFGSSSYKRELGANGRYVTTNPVTTPVWFYSEIFNTWTELQQAGTVPVFSNDGTGSSIMWSDGLGGFFMRTGAPNFAEHFYDAAEQGWSMVLSTGTFPSQAWISKAAWRGASTNTSAGYLVLAGATAGSMEAAFFMDAEEPATAVNLSNDLFGQSTCVPASESSSSLANVVLVTLGFLLNLGTSL